MQKVLNAQAKYALYNLYMPSKIKVIENSLLSIFENPGLSLKIITINLLCNIRNAELILD